MLHDIDDGDRALPEGAMTAIVKGLRELPSESVRPVLICFSHLRWDFVYQRPQHLLSRFARTHRVYYFEEPVYDQADTEIDWLEKRLMPQGITVAVPHLRRTSTQTADEQQRVLIDELVQGWVSAPNVLWYYTPMSLAFSDHLVADIVVYDCMDELSAFRGAPSDMVAREQALFDRADVVFTGGYSLYEAKRTRHGNVHSFPSSVDVDHFRKARTALRTPCDQLPDGPPRLGFYGVIDERFDVELVGRVAALRPEWQWVFIGPVAKIDPASLPLAPNIHFPGPKPYSELPSCLSGWDVALMPFLMNESTQFISPTKTPEYLAAGRPVVSTPINDVVKTYGSCPLVHIASGAEDFVAACEAALSLNADSARVMTQADQALSGMSWDDTWQRMTAVMVQAVQRPAAQPARKEARKVVGTSSRGTGAGYDYVIVGAGFAGSVLAERLAADSGQRVLLIDKRPHIGGNAYDALDSAGVLVHRYGPHIFHTNASSVVQYLSRFTGWRPYEHRVLAAVDGQLVPMPINLHTLAMLYGRPFSSQEAETFLAMQAEICPFIRNSEDAVVSKVGRELYEKFFRGYTRKQWGLDPSDLDASVTARVPARLSHDDRYFTDSFQAMPQHGYTRMFQKMLAHPLIDIRLDTDYRDLASAFQTCKVIYTGPIDEYFDFCFGRLPYRSLRFRHETFDRENFQPAAVVNYPAEDVSHTRITEYKYLTGQRHAKTSVTYEYPAADGDPYYPIPRPENAALYKRYQALADLNDDVLFVGRLGTYKYYNMDQVVAQALSTYARIKSRARTDSPTAQPALA